MTSKEALKYLLVNSEELYNQYEEDEKFYLDAVELYNIVLKDLEILEILKRMVKVRKGNTWYYLDTEHPFFESKEDIDKVKEWLESGKNDR